MAKFAPYGTSFTGKPRKLLSDWELLQAYGEEGGLPGFAGNVGVPIHEREPAEFTDDWYFYQNPEWSAPLWQEGAFANISPPSRNAGFSMPLGEKNVRGPWTAMGQTWREAPGEKDRPEPLNPQQVAVSNEIISRGHDPQHIYDIYSATTKVDAAGQPVLPLKRVHSQKQQDLAGRIINESIASARETRPELFTEPAASGESILPSQSVTDEQIALAQGGGGPGRLGQSGALSNVSEARALSSNEILPQPASGGSILPSRFSNLPPLGPRDPGVYEPLNINNYVRYGEAVDRRQPGPPTPEAPVPLQQEVSGEQAAAVPIDPADLVGGSFFGPKGEPVHPGSGYRYTDNVLKGPKYSNPFGEIRALSEENAGAGEFIHPLLGMGVSSYLGAPAAALNVIGDLMAKYGSYHPYNPEKDANLFVDPMSGKYTWSSTDPGGGGRQRGTLNAYNMLQDLGSSYPNLQVQTPSRIGPTGETIKQYANARDLAYIRGQGDRPPPGLYTQQTPVGYQDFGEGHNVTKQEALTTYNRTGAGALLNEAAERLGPNAGYNETSALAESMAEDLQGQVDYGDWGDWY